jgi:hypothetical protein
MITMVPQGLKEALLTRLETEDVMHIGTLTTVLAAGADVPMAERAFLKLCDLRRTIMSSPSVKHELEWAVTRQLEELLRTFPARITVEAMSQCISSAADGIELHVITSVYSRVGRSGADLRDELDGELREKLRSYLKRAVAFAVREEDFSGELKANVGSVLGSIGSPDDMTDLRELIRADIERVRRGRAARAKGDRGKLGNGATMSYSSWHIRSIVKLDDAGSDVVLLDLLNEPEYERDVATELARRVTPPKVQDSFLRKVDYAQLWAARAGVPQEDPYNERRDRYASAIRGRIDSLLKEREGVKEKRPYDYRLRQLGLALAIIDSRRSANFVFELTSSLPDEWDNYAPVEAYEAMLFNGVALPTGSTLSLLDSVLERSRRYGVQQQDQWLLKRFLCLLPFVDNPERGIDRIRQLIVDLKLYPHQLREVLEALGNCRSDHALSLLQELASDKGRAEQLGDAWISAVAALDTSESRNLLLSFIDPDLPGLPDDIGFVRDDVLANRIAGLARRDPSIKERLYRLCGTQLSENKRSLLAKVIGQFGDLEAVSAGLTLIDDTLNPPVPYEIWKQIESAFVERRPHGESANTFTLEPRSANTIRTQLLDMVSKADRQKKAALTLLAQIEEWRLEYGRPPGEPRHPVFDSKEPWPPVPNA